MFKSSSFFLMSLLLLNDIDVQNISSMYMSLRHTSYFVLNSAEDHTQIIKVFIDKYIGHAAVITDEIQTFCMHCTMSENLTFFLQARCLGKVWGDIYFFIWSKLKYRLDSVNQN